MRLIDADALLDELRNTETSLARKGVYLVKGECSLYKIIKEQPTAYDVEKVVEELEESSIEFEVFGRCSEFVNSAVAVDIVKRGGVDERKN